MLILCMRKNAASAPLRRGFWETLFTPQERQALAFLLVVLAVGLGLIGWRTVSPQAARSAAGSSAARAHTYLQVRINSANAQELESLPGVGPKMAERIVAERAQHGYFLTLEDLKRVKGVNQKFLERVQGMVRFD